MHIEELKDQRWAPYLETFHTLPVYYFNSLQYPSTYEQASMILKSLELDMQNIDAQFIERDLETQGQRLDEDQLKDYNDWKTKALRAQKMKLNQIKLIEAWMLDNPPPYSESLRELDRRISRIERSLNLDPNSF